jgi:RHS repeat-associated protein
VVNTSDGTVAQQLDYDEFGRVTLNTNPGFQPFGFAGGLYDNQTDLVRFGARDYDASTGRWTSKDPLLLASDLSVYVYALGDPINLLDPDGENAIVVTVFGGALAGAGLELALQLWQNCFDLSAVNWADVGMAAVLGGALSGVGGGLLKFLNRPYWRYVNPGSNPASNWLTRGRGWKPPYGRDFQRAQQMLQLPHMPTNVVRVDVTWWKYVAGPRRVQPWHNPQWGSGGGWEYYRAWRFPR